MTWSRVLGVAWFAAALVALMPAAPAAAETVTRTGQASYTCQFGYYGPAGTLQQLPDEHVVSVSMSLGVPRTVNPGLRVPLRGVFRMQFPESIRSLAEQGGLRQVEAYSDSLTASMTVNGRTAPHRADRWQTGKQEIRDPMVVSAPITFPAYPVPGDASGKWHIELPANGTTRNIASPSPATVAFSVIATVTRYNGDEYEYFVSCYQPQNTTRTVAQVPVIAAAERSADSPAPSDPVPDPTAPRASGGRVASQAPAPDGAAPFSAPAAAPQPADAGAPVAASSAPGTGAVAAPLVAAPPPGRSDGIHVPGWAVVFGGGLLALAALGYAAWAHHRLRLLREDVTGHPIGGPR